MAILRRVKRMSDVDPAAEISHVLDGYELPSFPRVVTTAIEKVSSLDADMGDVADTLKDDPGLSVHLLRLVNSASFAPRRPIVDLHQAVMMLGRNHLESLLISLAVNRTLPNEPAPGFDSREFWSTAARRATVAAAFANLLDPSRRSENFTAALLNDLALPVLAHQVDGYGDLLAEWRASREPLWEMERGRFGWDHQAVGGLMCRTWEFPEQLTDAIASHHEPVEASDILPLVKVVSAVRDFDGDERKEGFITDVNRIFGLPAEQAEAILDEALADASATASMFV